MLFQPILPTEADPAKARCRHTVFTALHSAVITVLCSKSCKNSNCAVTFHSVQPLHSCWPVLLISAKAAAAQIYNYSCVRMTRLKLLFILDCPATSQNCAHQKTSILILFNYTVLSELLQPARNNAV